MTAKKNPMSPESGNEWQPPRGPGTVRQAAGEAWDAVRAPVYLGDRAMAVLGNRQGAVIREPYRRMLYWLVPPGATQLSVWPPIDRIDVFGTACYVDVPQAGHTSGIGPYWLREPGPGNLLTDPALLHDALAAAVAEQFGPRAVGA